MVLVPLLVNVDQPVELVILVRLVKLVILVELATPVILVELDNLVGLVVLLLVVYLKLKLKNHLQIGYIIMH